MLSTVGRGQQQLTRLHYDDKAAICAAINNGDDEVRSVGTRMGRAVVQIVHEQQAAGLSLAAGGIPVRFTPPVTCTG